MQHVHDDPINTKHTYLVPFFKVLFQVYNILMIEATQDINFFEYVFSAACMDTVTTVQC